MGLLGGHCTCGANNPTPPAPTDSREIPLTKGHVAIVDADDYPLVSAHKWRANEKYRVDGALCVHAMRTIKVDGKETAQFLHRLLMNAPSGAQVDHIDGNGLNNTRANLRLCTNAENGRNRRIQTNGSSRFKGVGWHKKDRKWSARIKVNGKLIWLGCFADEMSAAKAYDAAAETHFGAFARKNFEEVCA